MCTAKDQQNPVEQTWWRGASGADAFGETDRTHVPRQRPLFPQLFQAWGEGRQWGLMYKDSWYCERQGEESWPREATQGSRGDSITSFQPDIVVWSQESKQAVLIELTVPWEERIQLVHDCTLLNYQSLIFESQQRGRRRLDSHSREHWGCLELGGYPSEASVSERCSTALTWRHPKGVTFMIRTQ